MYCGDRGASTQRQGRQLVLRHWEWEQEGRSGPFVISSPLQWLSFPWCCSFTYLFSLGCLAHTQLSIVCLTSPHWNMIFLFTLSSFILQFSSKTGNLKLIGKFINTQSVLWLITTSQVFARVKHSLLSLLFCLQQCWFILVKLWIKDPNNHADIKYLSVITEWSLFYPNIQFFYHVCMGQQTIN